MFLFDPGYLLLFIVTLVISGAAQLYVNSAYKKWSGIRNALGMTGLQVGQAIVDRTSLGDFVNAPQSVQAASMVGANGSTIRFQRVSGQLTDHYDPRTHSVSLSDGVATQPSVASMAIVAHELGHAQQHEQSSVLMAMRSFLVPAVQFSPQIAYVMIFLGLLLRSADLITLGALVYGVMVLFTLITLPVEIDASRRALVLLREANLVQIEEDAAGARQVLTAAALTYVAAAVTAVLTLMYYLSLGSRRR
ncbi:MAG TPA: zinc metallopeptidase [Anaerolineae bacterium]|nr:zinc metallopeptidase [Anaerolineae bacterium]